MKKLSKPWNQLLLEWRLYAGLTQREASGLFGCSYSLIDKVEQQKCSCPPYIQKKLNQISDRLQKGDCNLYAK